MKIIDIVFIILHYQNTGDTVDCVNSIQRNLDTNNYLIVIVDNGSTNNSYQDLITLYNDNPFVDCICCYSNLGFARGLNFGIDYVRKFNSTDFIVLLNNDTNILGKNWFSVIKEKYKLYSYHIMGPKIVDENGNHTANPDPVQYKDIRSVKQSILKKKISYVLYYTYLIFILKYCKKLIYSLLNINVNNQKQQLEDKRDICENLQIEGSAIILSKLYFDKMNGLYDRTFLYVEEAIMKHLADCKNMKIVYTPEISLLHKRGKATQFSCKTDRQKKIFYLKHSIHSCQQLLSLMRQNNI